MNELILHGIQFSTKKMERGTTIQNTVTAIIALISNYDFLLCNKAKIYDFKIVKLLSM